MKVIEQNIKVCGLVTELTNSQRENFGIMQNHWSDFNAELKRRKLNQIGGNWTKYGITFKADNRYFYLTAIPVTNFIIPDNFSLLVIPKGTYKIFTHKGKMETFISAIISETDESEFQKKGKNIYITNNEKNIRLTINSYTNRIITVDKLNKKQRTANNGYKQLLLLAYLGKSCGFSAVVCTCGIYC